METGVSTYLLTQGVLGVSVLVLGYVVGKLYSKTERLEKEKSDIAEARRLDDKEQYEKSTTNYSIQSGIVSGISSASKLT